MINSRKEEFVFVSCNVCHQDNTIDYLRFQDYKYVQCTHCGLIYQNPQPHFTPLKKRYSKKYFNYELRNQENFFNLMKLSLQDVHFFNKLAKKFPESTRKFLDIGCATGLLLNFIRKHQWQVLGIEMDPFSVDYAKKRFHLPLINKPIEEASIPEQSIDVVHWSHVIEHLTSPILGLNKIYRLLKPGGYMLLTTPRVDSFQQNYFKQNWRSFHRDHLYIFSRDTLLALLKKSNFKIIRFFSWGGIEQGKAHPLIKLFIDKSAKRFNFGDVMFVLAKK